MLGEEQQVVLALMRSLIKIMTLDIFSDGVMQRRFAEKDHAIEALIFDGADKPFGESILS